MSQKPIINITYRNQDSVHGTVKDQDGRVTAFFYDRSREVNDFSLEIGHVELSKRSVVSTAARVVEATRQEVDGENAFRTLRRAMTLIDAQQHLGEQEPMAAIAYAERYPSLSENADKHSKTLLLAIAPIPNIRAMAMAAHGPGTWGLLLEDGTLPFNRYATLKP